MAPYVPDRGDIIWLDFNPQAGREQGGRRPALVLSPAVYNGPSGLLVCCPMTSRAKGYPFEVPVADDPPSVVLVDHVRSLDWRARRASRKDRIGDAELAMVSAKLRPLLGI